MAKEIGNDTIKNNKKTFIVTTQMQPMWRQRIGPLEGDTTDKDFLSF